MRVDLYGLLFETAEVTFYLWSPWRGSALEHRLFDAIKQLPHAKVETAPDELRVALTDGKSVQKAILAVERILKGWQEEASEAGGDRRTWRWLVEADTDAHGYDHAGEKTCLWAFLRLTIERNGTVESEKGFEDIDLNGFGLKLAGNKDE